MNVVVLLDGNECLIDVVGPFDSAQDAALWITDNKADAEVLTRFDNHELSTP